MAPRLHRNVSSGLPGILALTSVCLGACTDTAPVDAAAPQEASPLSAPPTLTDFPEGPPSDEPDPIPPMRAAPAGTYAKPVDVLAYDIEIAISDVAGWTQGRTRLDVARTGALDEALALDFTGLHVDSVAVDGARVDVTLEAGRLHVPFPDGVDRAVVEVMYRGVPDDGLILGTNVHGDPSAFVDNWPNRARFWFPGVDHPSDKATVRYTVHAPGEWRVVANGSLESPPEPTPEGTFGPPTGSARRTWVWNADVPISTYNMVIGGAEMAVDTVGLAACGRAPASPRSDGCVAVTTWLFPESRTAGAPSFARAAEMVDFFTRLVGPFPYQKLANVQSSTRFGGMENASAIFYSEEGIASGRDIEGTVSHEIAHQWFGDSVTEAEWSHLWLSEGFATYFGAHFFEEADGIEAFRERMESARQRVLSSEAAAAPILTERASLIELLDANNYQKGAWVLHMLRGVIGDQAFFEAIRAYYARFEHGVALSSDLQAVVEEVSGEELGWFFTQWLERPGYPVLSSDHRYDAAEGVVEVTVRQEQPAGWPTFRLPLVVAVETASGTERHPVEITGREQVLRLEVGQEPQAVVLDPDGWVLKALAPESGR